MKKIRPKSVTKTLRKLSKRAQVQAAFEDGGRQAALDKAKELRVRPSRIQKWLRRWGDGRVPVVTPRPGKVMRIRPGQSASIKENDFVCMDWDHPPKPHQIAKVIKKGPEQSEVKFANGNVRVVVNTWMVPIGELPEQGR